MEKTYYEKFGLDENASLDEIKRAYRRLAFKYHPDRNAGDLKSENIFKEVNRIYHVLSNPISRAEYDAKLRRERESFKQRDWFTENPSWVYTSPKNKQKSNAYYRRAAIITFLSIKILYNLLLPPEHSQELDSEYSFTTSNSTPPNFEFK